MIKLSRLSIALVLVCGLIGILQTSKAQTQNPQTKGKQGTKPEEVQDEQQLGIRTINVRLPITVTEGKSTRFVTDLKEADFEIYEDKVPQKILSFQLTDLP